MPSTTTYLNALQLATLLHEYRLDGVLGAGGFGITYLAWDTHLEKKVAIKEYLPTELAVRAIDGSVLPVATDRAHDYQWGMERFLQEARTLARFSHPNIVRVNRYFEAHGTAYVVMDYEEGESLAQALKIGPPPDEAALLKLTMPLLEGLQAVHEAGFLHRDIKPANVFIRTGSVPVLLDFGAARQALGGATRSLTSVLTPGYAPLEQYSSDGNQGPWTDIYALGGVLYRAVTGENPPEATRRLHYDAVPEKLRALYGRVGTPLLRAIEWAMNMDEKQRPRCVRDWGNSIDGRLRPAAELISPTVPLANAVAATRNGFQPRSGSRLPPPAISTAITERPRPVRQRRSYYRSWAVFALLSVAVIVWAGRWREPAPVQAADRRGQTASAATVAAPADDAQRNAPAEPAAAAGAPTSTPVASAVSNMEPRVNEVPPEPAPDMGPITHDVRHALVTVEERPHGILPPPGPTAHGGPAFRPGPRTMDRIERHDMDTRPFSPPRAPLDYGFIDADRNRDGYLTRDEAHRLPLLARHYARADADGDGRISPQELGRIRQIVAQQRFAE